MIDPSIIRHPEKFRGPDNISPRKPSWIRVKAATSAQAAEVRGLMRKKKLHTVCEEAACPNIGECWEARAATFIILGDVCTRACAFCNVKTGKPGPVDAEEPVNLAQSVVAMGLAHVVITSVDRDDLADGGASQFIACIKAVRTASPGTTIEILTPDFRHKSGRVQAVAAARPDVFNHNLETAPRLYPSIRPGADYRGSLDLLRAVKEFDPGQFTKSGIMVGLGENEDEVFAVMDDMREAGVDFLTIGQYLQPTLKHVAISRYVTPEEFDKYADIARQKGFLMVASSPLTRSSHHAGRDFKALQEARSLQQKGI